jgi:hypothetical protein
MPYVLGHTASPTEQGEPSPLFGNEEELTVEGIWDPFAESNFWFRNLNKTPLVFLKPSSQVNNFTVFFHFFIGM